MSPTDKSVYAPIIAPEVTVTALEDIVREREKQVTKWGVQHRPDHDFTTTHQERYREEVLAKALCDYHERKGPGFGYTGGATWEHVIREELAEALNAQDKLARRKELIQAAAVLVAWIEDLDTH